MDNYQLPGDDGRKMRKSAFMSILRNPELGYIDGATDFCLLPMFADDFKLNGSQRVWLAFLYGVSYSQTTAMRIFFAFPECSITRKGFARFWEANKETLYFNPDRVYLKNNDQVWDSISCFLSLCGDNCSHYWSRIKKDGFKGAYDTIVKQWRYFGPMGAYLFFDAVYGLLPKAYVDPTVLDWPKCGKPVVQGMAHLMYLDELVPGGPYTPEILSRFNKAVDTIQEKTEQPKVLIESTLCAFRKLFKGTRYFGYYSDRMLEECHQVSKLKLPEGLSKRLWEYREQTIPESLLGEKNTWKGIRKERMGIWLNTGKLL